MANRVIRDWTASESVDLLTVKAEVFFTRLIMKADDYGNYTGNPKLIAAALFPLKMYDVSSILMWMEECEKAGLIVLYENAGKKYIHIPNFGQTLRRMKAVYPAPNIDGSLRTSDGQVTAETKGKETEEETEEETERKQKQKVIGSGDFFLFVKAKYLNDPILKIYNLETYFTETDQWNQIQMAGWGARAAPFLKDNPGAIFDDETHLYNSFRKYALTTEKKETKLFNLDSV